MKKLFALITFIAVTLSAMAVPARRVTKTVTCADGTTVQVTLRGDETFHFYVAADGTPMREQADGTWVKDTRDISAEWGAAKAKRNYHRTALARRMRRAMKAPARIGQGNAGTGTKKGLLILVNFKDVAMVNGSGSNAIFNQMLNDIGNPYGDNYGSVREYFRAQSYGQFDITFDVVGPVTVSQNMSYYGGNDSSGDDKAPEIMIQEACKLVDSQVNFADYDWDGDGEVENIYVTYAGYGEASGGSANTIWPHQWQLTAGDISLKLDGVKIDTYACGAELYGDSGTTIDGIGTMCHEYSHCLGLPDFYDTDYSGGQGMFDWDLMDGGSYNDGGYCPAAYTAYEREYCGWLTYTELSTYTEVTDMPNIEDNKVAYVVRNAAHPDEYYVLANHQQKGWNRAEAGHGLLVIHVDYDQSVWESNGPNDDPSHQRLTIIPADNKFDYTTYEGNKYYYATAGDTYPGSKNNTALTDSSTPSAKLYNANTDGKKLMHKEIEDITETNGLISFTFMRSAKPKMPAPTLNDIADFNATSLTATWSEVENATAYNLRYRTVTIDDSQVSAADALLMKETFKKMKITSEKDVSSTLNDYTDNKGWTGSKVFAGPNGTKLGSSSYAGYLVSPAMTCTSGTVSLYVCLAPYVSTSDKPDTQDITIALRAKGSTTDISKQTFKPSAKAYYSLTFNDVPTEFQIYIGASTSKRRFHISLFMAFDGEFEKDDMAEVLNSGSSVRALAPLKARTIYGDWMSVEGLTTTSYTLNNLQPATTYEIQVQSVGAEDPSEWTASKSVTLPLVGDVNADGEVNDEDAMALLNHIIGYFSPTTAPINDRLADVNCDGHVGVADLTAILSIIEE